MTNTTLLIDINGNIVLDVAGNFTFADGIDQVSQDCWLAAQTHVKDIWYNQQYGMPYFDGILGFNPTESYVTHHLKKTLENVINVKSVAVNNVKIGTDRTLNATANITMTNGQTFTITI